MGLPENYRDQLLKLLPRGMAWAIDTDSFVFKFVYALGDELARVHERALDLIRERNPQTATELLADYERNLGLPGKCGTIADNPADRRAAVVAKMVATGGQSKQYFIDVAAASGIDITISTFMPLLIGFDVGSEMYGGPWIYTWVVSTDDVSLSYFTAGHSSSGDPLVTVANQQAIECLLSDIAPAHTYVVYRFGV